MPKRISVEDVNIRKPDNSRLTALELSEKINGRCYVLCLCSCGQYKKIQAVYVCSGATLSCGCLNREMTIARNKRGKKLIKAKKKENYLRKVWYNMIERCTNINHFAYKSYGAKGVLVCEEWLNDYDTFKKWAMGNGWHKGVYLDKDIKGDGKLYSPKTCCFVDRLTSDKNKTTDVKYEYGGKMLSVADIAKEANVIYSGLLRRVRQNMPIEDAIDSTRNKVVKKYKVTEAHRKIVTDSIRKEVVDIDTGRIFYTIREAAKHIGFTESYLSLMLNGKEPNKTRLVLAKRQFPPASF